MRVDQNGKLLRTIPISAGKPGFTTRSGIKVIIEKFRVKRMDAATTGIDESDPEYYNIENVEYAQRVTYSGEFLHAAPWSVGSQGSANVSHGCVGMSTANAAWLYGLTKRGDVVDVTGTDRHMTPTTATATGTSPSPTTRRAPPSADPPLSRAVGGLSRAVARLTRGVWVHNRSARRSSRSHASRPSVAEPGLGDRR